MIHPRLRLALAAVACVLVAASPAFADNYAAKDSGGTIITFAAKLVGGILYPFHIMAGLVGGVGAPQPLNVSSAGVLATADTSGASNNAAFQGAVLMTLATTYPAQRSVGANCSAAGSMTLTLADASSVTLPVSIGWNQYPFAATAVASTTATCTFSNLK